jgi:hypothetical protein
MAGAHKAFPELEQDRPTNSLPTTAARDPERKFDALIPHIGLRCAAITS